MEIYYWNHFWLGTYMPSDTIHINGAGKNTLNFSPDHLKRKNIYFHAIIIFCHGKEKNTFGFYAPVTIFCMPLQPHLVILYLE